MKIKYIALVMAVAVPFLLAATYDQAYSSHKVTVFNSPGEGSLQTNTISPCTAYIAYNIGWDVGGIMSISANVYPSAGGVTNVYYSTTIVDTAGLAPEAIITVSFFLNPGDVYYITRSANSDAGASLGNVAGGNHYVFR